MTAVTKFLADLLERAVKTCLEVYVLLLSLSGMAEEAGIVDWSTAKKFAVSAIGGGLSVLASLISRGFGRQDSASALPAVAEQ